MDKTAKDSAEKIDFTYMKFCCKNECNLVEKSTSLSGNRIYLSEYDIP
jgi:hypothetical protein